MTVPIKNSVALVTGANRGIGYAITKGFLEAGAAKVYTAVRDLSSVTHLREHYPDRIVPIEYDLTRKETAAAAANIATDVTIVVANAGVIKLATPLDEDMVEGLKFQMERNVFSVIHLAQAFGPILKANGGGAFVQLNSLASLKNFLPFTSYSASKAAAYSVTQGLREAWMSQGTQVISVLPGPIKTDMADSAGMGEGAPSPSVVAEGILAALKSGDFFVYPDQFSKDVSRVYQPFATHALEIER